MSEKLRFAHTDEQRWAALRDELHEQGKVKRQQLIELVGIRNELKAQNERMDCAAESSNLASNSTQTGDRSNEDSLAKVHHGEPPEDGRCGGL